MRLLKKWILPASFLFLALTCACTPKTENPSNPTAEPTPHLSDSSDETATNLPVVYTNYESGFYDNSIELTLSCPIEGARIYYTTDGSLPDTSDTLYETAITLKNKSKSPNILSARTDVSAGTSYVPEKPVEKANIIRAVAYLPDGTVTSVTNGTYFVGIDHKAKYGDIPVISLLTDMDNLFNYETGIYTLGKTYDEFMAANPNNASLESWQRSANFTNRGREWERPVAVELITADGSSGFQLDMGMRIKGGASRNATQKSLRLIAREDYGAKALQYELIPDNMRSDATGTVEKYKSFVLRNGGNDSDSARLRDPLLQLLISNRRVETMQFTPCIVYLDGEYWGMYTIVENYDDNYIENNYGIDNQNVVMVKVGQIEEGEEADIDLYNEMYDYITGNDMSVTYYYNEAAKLLDMGSFIDYCAFQLYIYNQDSMFQNNNWEMWRVRTADMATAYSDGKWRMMVYDTDYSTGIYSEGNNYRDDNISPLITDISAAEQESNLSYRHPVELFRSLYQNKEFKKELILTLCDMRNCDFEADAAISTLDTLSVDYKKNIPSTITRFGPDWIVLWNDPATYYSKKLQELSVFLRGRYSAMPKIMQNAFGLGIPVSVTVSANDSTMGTVQINQTLLDLDEPFVGSYFSNYSITLTALPVEGYRFTGWEYSNCFTADTSLPTIVVNPSEGCTLTAVFEKE